MSQVGCYPSAKEEGRKGPNLIAGGRIKGCSCSNGSRLLHISMMAVVLQIKGK